jgi:hypothetical protein
MRIHNTPGEEFAYEDFQNIGITDGDPNRPMDYPAWIDTTEEIEPAFKYDTEHIEQIWKRTIKA